MIHLGHQLHEQATRPRTIRTGRVLQNRARIRRALHSLHARKGPQMAEGNVAADQLRLFIERIERLEGEKTGIADDVRDVYLEAKATGYDTKAMRGIIALRKKEPHVRQTEEALLETYKAALGME